LITKSELKKLYRREEDAKVKERLLLILRVEVDGAIPASAAKQLHRSRPWASYWLERFSKEGLDGLGDKPRSGRPSKLPVEVVMRIRRRLSESKEGWTTRQVQELIAKMGGGVTYHYTHVYRLLHRWGFKLKVPRRRHINTASKMEKMAFKKR
jgi:transposase